MQKRQKEEITMKTVTKTINGTEYTAVWKGTIFANEAFKHCKVGGTNVVSDYKLAKIVFSDIIIDPEISIDDFEDMNEFYEVVDFGGSVLFGTYFDKSKSALKKEVESEWGLWRLVFNDIAAIDYDYVFNVMTPEEINKANIALDITAENIRKSMKKR